MELEKWQALGNDYLIVEASKLPFPLTPARIKLLCNRNFGIGSDGVLLLEEGDGEAVARLRIFNPDGSEAELSGNGAREAALYLHLRGWTKAERFRIATKAGTIEPQILPGLRARLFLGRARLASPDFPGGPADGRGTLTVAGYDFHFQHVNVGNPQCAIGLSDLAALEGIDLSRIGPPIEANPLFPNRTNVSFFVPTGENRIRARIFERGVGETLSSGTGAAGAAVAYALGQGRLPATVTVELDGGELEVEVSKELDLHQTGWARPVFRAVLDERFSAELAAIEQDQERS
jgi:diaminopimelate epimerase